MQLEGDDFPHINSQVFVIKKNTRELALQKIWRTRYQNKYMNDDVTDLQLLEVVTRSCSVKKIFLKISQNSQENNCVAVSFLIKKELLFYRTPRDEWS